jgi:Tfp pilus assembly protein PilP
MKMKISNPPLSPFNKGGCNCFPSFLKRGEGRLPKIIYLLLIIFLLFTFGGCKKEQAPVKKPMAEKVKPAEVKKDVKEAEEAKKVVQEVYTYDSKGRRDPFLALVAISKEKPTKRKGASPIESFSIEEISLLAIARDKEKHYALIMLPDKKNFTITEGMTLGLQGGKVEKITDDMVVIREFVKDYKGNIEAKDTVLKLHKEEE